MRLSAIIEPRNIVMPLRGESIEDVIKNLVAASSEIDRNRIEEISKELLLREKRGGTMLGRGVFFPHARIASGGKVRVAFGISDEGIPLDTPDGIPVKFSFMVAAPFDKNELLLNCRAAFLKLFLTGDYAAQILDAKSREDVYSIILESGINITETLIAADVMSSDIITISPNEKLRDILDIMFGHAIGTLPVVNEDRKLVGVVSCQEILRMAIPKFVDGLTSLSFVTSHKPFDYILAHRDDISAKNIMETDFLKAHSKTSLLQIAHMLTSSNKRFVYITDPDNDDHFLGIIERRELLTKLLVY